MKFRYKLLSMAMFSGYIKISTLESAKTNFVVPKKYAHHRLDFLFNILMITKFVP